MSFSAIAQVLFTLLLASHVAACAPLFAQNFQAPDAPQAAPGAEYNQTYNKVGFETKYVSLAGFDGLLSGGRAVQYFGFNRSVYAGLMFFGTVPFVTKDWTPVFGYSGLQAGYEGYFGPLDYDATVLVGATSNLSECTPNPLGQQLTVEPGFSLGMRLPFLDGLHISVVYGLLVLPLALESSGWTVGLRLDQKSLSATVPAAN
ncbi:MAG: hypothetical protein VKN33_08170 [Candidatus Sericytochromatia bacterium]|nr:hypothetical protein [Candidatus Sericytochromatia bacterium]